MKHHNIKNLKIYIIEVAGGSKPVAVAAAPKPRKKKLYWKALDASKVGRDSLWAQQSGDDAADSILLDEDEFNKLFVDRSKSELY